MISPSSRNVKFWGQASIFYIFLLAALACRPLPTTDTDSRFPNLVRHGFVAPAPAPDGAFLSIPPRPVHPGLPPFFRFDSGMPVTLNAAFAPDQGFYLVFPLPFIHRDSFYLFSAEFSRSYNIVGVYPEVRFCGQTYVLDDFWAQGKSQLLSLVVEAPENVPKSSPSLAIFFPKNDYLFQLNKVRFQSITILPRFPLSGGIENGASILFSWDMPSTDRLLEINIHLSPDKDFSSDRSIRIKTDNRYREWTVPNMLDEGNWFWRLEVFFNGRRVALSERRRFYVPAKINPGVTAAPAADIPPCFPPADYFPIGTYGATRENLPALASMGLNAAVMSASDTQDLVSLVRTASRYGIHPLVSYRRPFLDRNALDDIAPGDRRLLQSDAVLGWYLDDEPEGRSVSPQSIRDRRDLLRKAGLLQPGAIALERAWRAPDYAPAVDVFMSDQYPVPFNPMTWLSESLDTVAAAIGRDDKAVKQSWAVIQAFDWARSSPQARATGRCRMPTVEEVRNLCWLSICHGATGLFFYTYAGGSFFDEAHQMLWRGIPGIVQELGDITPILTAPTSNIPLSITTRSRDEWGHPALHALLKNGDRHLFFSHDFFSPERAVKFKQVLESCGPDPIFLIAVNSLAETVSGEIILDTEGGPPFLRAVDMLGHRSFPISGNTLPLSFDPLERKLFLLETNNPFPR